jgi:replicative DNA helicase
MSDTVSPIDPDTATSPRIPPHSIEAEQSVLGGLMLAEDAWDRVADRVSEEDFYRREHRLLFRAIGELADRDQPRDVVTVSEWLSQRDELDSVGNLAYLGQLAQETPSAANITAYADIVRARSVLRQLIQVGNDIARAAYEPQGRESKELLDYAEQQVFAIADQGMRNQRGFRPIKSVLGDTINHLDTLFNSDSHITGLATGFNEFDDLTSGLQRSDLIVVAGRPSMGKCLAHDAEIVLEDGSVSTIEEIHRRRHGRVGTLRDDLQLDWAVPSDYVDDGHKPVFEVETRLGRRVETTLTHPFLTLEGWKPLAELEPGDYIAVPRRLPVFGSRPLRGCEVRLLAYLIGDGGLTRATPVFTATNPAIRRDFAEAVEDFGGLRLSTVKPSWRAPSWAVAVDHDSLADARSAFAVNLDRAIASSGRPARALAGALAVAPATATYWRQGRNVPNRETLVRLANELAVEPDDLLAGDGPEARRNRPNPLRQWLSELGLDGRDAHDKHIPESVFSLPREQLALFLNRLFATDGWASVWTSGQSQIGYSSVSERLARQVQHLLLRFGVIAKLRQRWVRYGDARRVSWQLDITHADSILRFADEIGIHGKETSIDAVYQSVASKRRQSNTDLVPVEVWILIEREKGQMPWSELARRAGVSCSNIHPHRRAISRHRLARFAMALQSTELMQLADSDVYWDRIEQVTALGEKQVYDLTIPDTHNFIANDICVHNTSYAMNIAENVALTQKEPVAVFSMEMPAEQIATRMISSLGRVEMQKLRSGRIDDADWPRINSAVSLLVQQSKLFIDDTPGLTPSELRARARRLKREHGLSLILIDYIQLMQVGGTVENRATEISEISRSLKGLAKELNVPVVVLSQLNRALEQRTDKRPVMSDLRESGAIEQDADVIVFIYRDEVYDEDSPQKGTAEILVRKQRNGPTGTVRLTFLGHYTRFENFTPEVYGADR